MDDETVPHRMVELIHRKKEVKVDEAAKILELDNESVMQYARILSEAKIVKIFYAVAGDVILKPGLEFERALETSTKPGKAVRPIKNVDVNTPEESQYVNDFLASVRKKIMEKRQGKGKPNVK